MNTRFRWGQVFIWAMVIIAYGILLYANSRIKRFKLIGPSFQKLNSKPCSTPTLVKGYLSGNEGTHECQISMKQFKILVESLGLCLNNRELDQLFTTLDLSNNRYLGYAELKIDYLRSNKSALEHYYTRGNQMRANGINSGFTRLDVNYTAFAKPME